MTGKVELILYFVTRLFDVLLGAVSLAMLARAVLSFFVMDNDGPLLSFLYAVTEPFIIPVRALFETLGWFQELPIDMSFFVSCLLIGMIRTLLEMIPVGL